MIAFARFLAVCVCVAGSLPTGQESKTTAASSDSWQLGGAVEVRSAEDVIAKWKPDQHLYVKGDLGISAPQLAKLENWLDEHGPHWTIVLMRQASDETYHALDQRTFYAMDAVEYALGHGLANRTDFGGLIHPTTGETDGAVFVLFLVEKKFSYYGSDLHDRRGLGESKWIGDLDREAVRAMRNGGRIVDAVKNTVTLINHRVQKQLRSEAFSEEQAKAAKERAALERLRELEFLKASLKETADQMLPRIEDSARQIRATFAEAAGSELANPPVEAWKKRLTDLQQDSESIEFESRDPYQQSPVFRKLSQNSNQLRGEVDRYLDLYAAHKSFGEIVSPVEQRLDLIADHPTGAAIPSSDEAYRILAEAREDHSRGGVEFVDSIERVEDLIDQGEQAIQIEEQRIQTESEKAKVIRRTVSVMASILAAGLLGILWMLNLRRRPALRRAHDAFDQSSKLVEAELNQIEPVVKRLEQVIGSKSAFAQMGFTGQTLDLGTRTLKCVQTLQDMGEEAKSVIAAAYQLLHPSNPLAEAANMISAGRYEHCVRMLSGPSLSTSSNVGVSTETPLTEQSAWITFGEFFTNLRRNADLAMGLLDPLEESLTQLGPRILELQEKLDSAVESEKELSKASRLDRYFRVPAFLEKLIPSAQKDCDRASQLVAKDPVQAMNQVVSEGLRKISAGLAVADSIRKARSDTFPILDSAGDKLRSAGFDIRWIEQNVRELGDWAEKLITKAITEPAAEEIRRFDGELMRLGMRARRAVELSHEIGSNIAPSLDQVEQEITAARRRVSQQLQIDQSKVLHESEYDPDVELAQAMKQLQSARAALDYGGVESVMESLEVVQIQSSLARDLVENTLVAVRDFSADQRSLAEQQSKLADRCSEVKLLIADRQTRYAESALIFRQHDEPKPNQAADSILGRMLKVGQIVANAAEVGDQAKKLHFAGRFLEAANLRQLTQTDLETAAVTLDEIQQHCTWLDKQSEENNLEMQRQQTAVTTVEISASDPRTQRVSRRLFEELETVTQQLHLKFKDRTRIQDPFLDQTRLSELAQRTEELLAMIGADWRAHAAATRSFEGAAAELKTAKQSVARSLADRIPDSQTIKKCQSDIEKFEFQLREVGSRLGTSHDDWYKVGQLADHLLSELAVVDGQLRRELELAQKVVQELKLAAEQVFEAASWSGSYGIKVVGDPGSQELCHARQSLAEGEYLAAMDYCRSANFHAKHAIDVARNQVRNKQREIAQIVAAARRRRESAVVVGGFSGASSFGSSSTRSSWSGSSGSSTGSSRSSSGGGSGFSRSGW